MISQGIQHDSESQYVRSHQEHEQEILEHLADPAAGLAEDDIPSVGKRMHPRVSHLELIDDVAGICGDEAKADDEKDSWDEAHD